MLEQKMTTLANTRGRHTGGKTSPTTESQRRPHSIYSLPFLTHLTVVVTFVNVGPLSEAEFGYSLVAVLGGHVEESYPKVVLVVYGHRPVRLVCVVCVAAGTARNERKGYVSPMNPSMDAGSVSQSRCGVGPSVPHMLRVTVAL